MNIEIFSDLVCPWCFIGKRRLDQVLSTPVGEGVNVIWRSYQLYPAIPEPGMARGDFMKARYGQSDPGAGRQQIESEAQRVGIRMRFDRIERMPNTLKGHRLLHRARQEGVQHQLAEALFSAYFEQGQDLGDEEVLLSVAVAQGMDIDATHSYLAGTEGTEQVLDELTRASNIGVSGVPCFVLAGAFALPGAQEPEVISHFIERAKTRLAASA